MSEKDSNSKSESKKSKPICSFYQRGSCTKGDECQFSHIGPTINENTSTSTDVAKPKAYSACGAKPKADSACGAKPKADSACGAKPKADSACGAKPKADSACGAKSQSICPWGYNCPIMRNGCPNKHVKMCPHGTECNKDGCFYYHHGK